MNTFRLLIVAVSLLLIRQNVYAEHRTDSLNQPKHEFAVGIGGPGLWPRRDVAYSTGCADPGSLNQSYSKKFLPTFYVQYLHNRNRYVAWGVMLSYAKSELNEHTIDIGLNYTYYSPITGDRMKAAFDDRYYRNDYLSMGGVFRVYWFHMKHASMYSKVEAGLTIRFRTETEYWLRWSNKDVWHYKNVLLDINLSPVCIDFGGTHFRGFIEIAWGTSYLGSAGVKYAF